MKFHEKLNEIFSVFRKGRISSPLEEPLCQGGYLHREKRYSLLMIVGFFNFKNSLKALTPYSNFITLQYMNFFTGCSLDVLIFCSNDYYSMKYERKFQQNKFSVTKSDRVRKFGGEVCVLVPSYFKIFTECMQPEAI